MTTDLIDTDKQQELPLPTFQSSQALKLFEMQNVDFRSMTEQYVIVQSPHQCSFKMNYLQDQFTVILQT